MGSYYLFAAVFILVEIRQELDQSKNINFAISAKNTVFIRRPYISSRAGVDSRMLKINDGHSKPHASKIICLIMT